MTVVQCWHISHCGDQKTMAGQGTAACPARVDRLERKVASAKAVYLHMDSSLCKFIREPARQSFIDT